MDKINKSIAFSKEKINRLNSYLSRIKGNNLFFVKNYNPKIINDFSKTDGYIILLTIMNLNSLFYDCTPWFFWSNNNTTGKDLSIILQEITGIDYTEIKTKAVAINKLRNSFCHNATPETYNFINQSFKKAEIKKTITQWKDINLDEEDFTRFFRYYIKPFDEYFDDLLAFFDKSCISTVVYNEEQWDTILRSAYSDIKYLNYMMTQILPAVYDYISIADKTKVSPKKESQINAWRRNYIDQNRMVELINSMPFVNQIDPEHLFTKILCEDIMN